MIQNLTKNEPKFLVHKIGTGVNQSLIKKACGRGISQNRPIKNNRIGYNFTEHKNEHNGSFLKKMCQSEISGIRLKCSSKFYIRQILTLTTLSMKVTRSTF